MICWYCYWGWAVPVTSIYNEALDELGGYSGPLTCGPSHIVWEDENFDDDSIQCCIVRCDEYTFDEYAYYTPEDIRIVRESLVKLLALKAEVRMPEPDDYDGKTPEAYPPVVPTAQVLR